MKWENVEKLYGRVREEFEGYGYFNSKSGVQSGVLRVNCMDCLDRTNVVQSVFAKHVLQFDESSL